MTIEELKQQRRFVLWKLELDKDGKLTKVPYQISGFKASILNPVHLLTYAELLPHVPNFAGIGMALGRFDGVYVWGVDFDKCLTDGKASLDVQHVLEDLNTYAEYSPSGTGVHIMGTAEIELPVEPGNKKQVCIRPYPGAKQVEVKGLGFYFTFTGNSLAGCPVELCDRTEAIHAFYQRVRGIQKPGQSPLTVSLPVSAEEKFKKLWVGDMSDYNNDHSAADFAMCIFLAQKYCCNAFKIDEEFRKSELYRDKWERDDYREKTITKAVLRVANDAATELVEDGPEVPEDWRTRYHTFEEMDGAPPPVFLINGFIQKGVITGVAGVVGQRKTIIAANIVHAVLTGEPLYGHFEVVNKPERVLYLCPEMGLFSFADRIRKLGLMERVGRDLFCRTMNSEGKLRLKDLTKEELDGALVVVDTAVRFIAGDENSSQDMKVFADECFRLVKDGASVVVLFHSLKGASNASELTLENAMRGSGDLGAFVSCCWATRLQDPDEPWESESYLKNVKQRDFESAPFTVKSDKQGRLHMVIKPGEKVKLNTKTPKNTANKDGKDDARMDFLRKNPDLSDREASTILKTLKMGRGRQWVHDKREELAIEEKGITYSVGSVTLGSGSNDDDD
jgi:AAA domain